MFGLCGTWVSLDVCKVRVLVVGTICLSGKIPFWGNLIGVAGYSLITPAECWCTCNQFCYINLSSSFVFPAQNCTVTRKNQSLRCVRNVLKRTSTHTVSYPNKSPPLPDSQTSKPVLLTQVVDLDSSLPFHWLAIWLDFDLRVNNWLEFIWFYENAIIV